MLCFAISMCICIISWFQKFGHIKRMDPKKNWEESGDLARQIQQNETKNISTSEKFFFLQIAAAAAAGTINSIQEKN